MSETKNDVKYVKPHEKLKLVKLYRDAVRNSNLNIAPKRGVHFQVMQTSLNRTYRELRHLAARVILELSSILALSHMAESIKASLTQNVFDYTSVASNCQAVQVNVKE